jgi:hypothetical protein
MAKVRGLDSGLGWPVVLVVMLLGYGVLKPSVPLETSRPPAASGGLSESTEERAVPARLWQDPLQAVRGVNGDGRTVRPGSSFPGWPSGTVSTNAESGTGARVVVNLIRGGDNPEDVERRLRSRYAVLTALGVAGYRPCESERSVLRWFAYDPTEERRRPRVPPFVRTSWRSDPLIVPYEWFRSSVPWKRNVLVVWVDEDRIMTAPLWHLRELFRDARDDLEFARLSDLTCPIEPVSRIESVEFIVIGPTDTDRLRALCGDTTHAGSARSDGPRFTVYSPWATGELGRDPPVGKTAGWRLVRTIGSDQELANLLMTELRLRMNESCNRIALVGEWDTSYGHGFASMFGAWKNVLWFNYLRGVDGRVPASRDSKDASEGSPRPGSPEKRAAKAAEQERAQGSAQIDYVRRMVGQLTSEFDRFAGKERPGAIGVLGSDVYDKLLLLRALRDRFPDVLFFTTDLDARLLHPSEYESTRNLLVASHFGLEVGRVVMEAGQQRVPAFRDSYQTSVFFAALKALRFAGLPEDDHARLSCPRVYEIARSGAYDLSVDPDPNRILPDGPRLRERGLRKLWLPCLVLTILGSFLLALMANVWIARRTPSRDSGRLEWKRVRRIWAWAVGLFIVPGFLILVLWAVPDSVAADGEPLEWFDGISVWPSVLVRLVAGTLSLVFIWLGYRSLSANREMIEQSYCILGEVPEDLTRKPWWALIASWLRYRCIPGWGAPASGGRASTLWGEYTARGLKRHRLARVIVLLVLYTPVTVCLFLLLGFPDTPYRGATSLVWHIISLAFAVVAMHLLVFLVWDATCLCDRLTRNLSVPGLVWSEDVARSVARSRGDMRECLGAWLVMRIVARRSAAVGRLIYGPFIVFLVMILSRHPGIDNWRWCLPLTLVVSTSLLITLGAAVLLRRSVKTARQRQIEVLKELLAKDVSHGRDGECIRAIIREIEAMEEGALGGSLSNPILGALLIPAGGVGMLGVFEGLLG